MRFFFYTVLSIVFVSSVFFSEKVESACQACQGPGKEILEVPMMLIPVAVILGYSRFNGRGFRLKVLGVGLVTIFVSELVSFPQQLLIIPSENYTVNNVLDVLLRGSPPTGSGIDINEVIMFAGAVALIAFKGVRQRT